MDLLYNIKIEKRVTKMIKKVNNKGMTLVEIVVVLLIASIIMTITGGILVNSLGYFDTTNQEIFR